MLQRPRPRGTKEQHMASAPSGARLKVLLLWFKGRSPGWSFLWKQNLDARASFKFSGRPRPLSHPHGDFVKEVGARQNLATSHITALPRVKQLATISAVFIDDQKFLPGLGKRLRDQPEARGLTQAQLTEKCNLHRTFIGSVECGR